MFLMHIICSEIESRDVGPLFSILFVITCACKYLVNPRILFVLFTLRDLLPRRQRPRCEGRN